MDIFRIRLSVLLNFRFVQKKSVSWFLFCLLSLLYFYRTVMDYAIWRLFIICFSCLCFWIHYTKPSIVHIPRWGRCTYWATGKIAAYNALITSSSDCEPHLQIGLLSLVSLYSSLSSEHFIFQEKKRKEKTKIKNNYGKNNLMVWYVTYIIFLRITYSYGCIKSDREIGDVLTTPSNGL